MGAKVLSYTWKYAVVTNKIKASLSAPSLVPEPAPGGGAGGDVSRQWVTEPQTVRPFSVVPVCNSSDPLPDLTHNLSREIPIMSHSNVSPADISLASNDRVPSTCVGQLH